MRSRVMWMDCGHFSTGTRFAEKWRARRAPSRTLALTFAQPSRKPCGRSTISSPIPHGTNSKRPMLPEGPTAGTGADGDRAAGLLLRLPMPARRREARRAWLPAEPERGLKKSKKFGALSFSRESAELSQAGNFPAHVAYSSVRTADRARKLNAPTFCSSRGLSRVRRVAKRAAPRAFAQASATSTEGQQCGPRQCQCRPLALPAALAVYCWCREVWAKIYCSSGSKGDRVASGLGLKFWTVRVERATFPRNPSRRTRVEFHWT